MMLCASRTHEPRPAAYRWWTHGGRYVHDLCVSCCGWWLIGALEDDEMTPHRIEALTPAGVDG